MAVGVTPNVSLWIRSEPFTLGALHVPPNPRLSLQNIKKIVAYAKAKGKSGYPNLSYSVWKHIGCNKLQLPEHLVWTYFVTFDLINDTPPDARILMDKRFTKCVSSQETDLLKSQMSVPLLRFVLYLYIQQMQKISLRASLVSGSDEWPSRARSPDIDGRSTPTGGGKILDEHSHMTFVLSNLTEIMEILLEPDSGAAGEEPCLSVEAVDALGLLIAGSIDNYRTLCPLKDIAHVQQVSQSGDYSKVNVETSRTSKGLKLRISRSYSFRTLQSWLRSHIGQNPFGVSSCISQGRHLSWPLAGEDKEMRGDRKRGRIVTNALLVPKDHIKGHKLIIMSQVCKQTVARSSGTLEAATIKIHRCHYSFIYLLSPLRAISIEKCRHSTIVLGAVETAVHISHCEQVTVIVACRRISSMGSSNCVFHVLTPTRPLIFGGNEDIVIAPYHTYYGQLESHMEKVGLSARPNLWDQPLTLIPENSDEMYMWKLMNPVDFYVFSIPFETDGPTKAIPGGLPPTYQKCLISRERQVENWQKMVKEAGLGKDQRKQFQSLVESRFQDWLANTGHKRELDGLVVPILGKQK